MSAALMEVTLSPEAVRLAGARAYELAGWLRLAGLGTAVYAKGPFQRHPCVEVRGGPGRPASGAEYLYAAPDDLCDESGSWSFWRGSNLERPGLREDERLGPLEDVEAAVVEVTARLGCGGGPARTGRQVPSAR